MDEYRRAIERMGPVHYLSAPYHERVLTAAATLSVELWPGSTDEAFIHVGVFQSYLEKLREVSGMR